MTTLDLRNKHVSYIFSPLNWQLNTSLKTVLSQSMFQSDPYVPSPYPWSHNQPLLIHLNNLNSNAFPYPHHKVTFNWKHPRYFNDSKHYSCLFHSFILFFRFWQDIMDQQRIYFENNLKYILKYQLINKTNRSYFYCQKLITLKYTPIPFDRLDMITIWLLQIITKLTDKNTAGIFCQLSWYSNTKYFVSPSLHKKSSDDWGFFEGVSVQYLFNRLIINVRNTLLMPVSQPYNN